MGTAWAVASAWHWGLELVEGPGPIFSQSGAQRGVRKTHRHRESQNNGDYVGRVYK